MRKRTGLANKYRTGRGGYDRRRSDDYGSWTNGIQTRNERINGYTLTYNHRKGEWNGNGVVPSSVQSYL